MRGRRLFSTPPSPGRTSREEIIAALRQLSALVGHRPLIHSEFQDWQDRPCSLMTLFRVFGSWRAAQQAAGIPLSRPRQYAPEELMHKLEQIWRGHGAPPGQRSLKRYDISQTPYIRRWGSVKNACDRLARYQRREISRAELLSPFRRNRAARTPIRPGIRWQILERDGHKCRSCGRTPDHGATLEIDHVVPVSAGGGNEAENLRTLCEWCNRGRGTGGSCGVRGNVRIVG